MLTIHHVPTGRVIFVTDRHNMPDHDDVLAGQLLAVHLDSNYYRQDHVCKFCVQLHSSSMANSLVRRELRSSACGDARDASDTSERKITFCYVVTNEWPFLRN